MNNKIVVAVLSAINLVIAAFFGFAYFAFTANMFIEYETNNPTVPMAHGGLHGGIYRYLFCIIAGLFLEAVMLIFNLSVMRFFVDDNEQVTRYCIGIGIASLCFLAAISAVKVVFNLQTAL